MIAIIAAGSPTSDIVREAGLMLRSSTILAARPLAGVAFPTLQH